MIKIEYNCLVCGGLVSTDPESPLMCVCPEGPTPSPLQAAEELSGNGLGLSNAQSSARIIVD